MRDQLFDEFWSIVWAKIAVGAARKAWKAKVKSKNQALKVIEAAKQQGPGILAHARDNGHSVLHPASWLNAERYDDEPPPLLADAVPTRVWTPEEEAAADEAAYQEILRLKAAQQEKRT